MLTEVTLFWVAHMYVWRCGKLTPLEQSGLADSVFSSQVNSNLEVLHTGVM